MKNIMRFLGIAAIVFSTTFMVTSCESEEDKAIKEAEKTVKELDKDMKDLAKEAKNLGN